MKRLRLIHKTSSLWNLIFLAASLLLAVMLNFNCPKNAPAFNKISLNPLLNSKGLNPKAEAIKIQTFNHAQLMVNYYDPNILNLPLLAQRHKNSGDAANIRMVLSYYGKNISEDKILLSFLPHSNPHKGFRGQVDKDPSLENYGVYAEAVVNVLKKQGINSSVKYFTSEKDLKNTVSSGMPVIVWVSTDKENQEKTVDKNYQGRYELIPGKRSMVVAGFTGGLWHLYDPGGNHDGKGTLYPEIIKVESLDSLAWDKFDHMAVIIDGK